MLVGTALEKRFGGVVALARGDLALAGGEVHVLMGANGSGKSTLCRIMAGALAPDGGTLSLDGVPMRFASPAAARAAGVGVVYQETSLIPTLPVGANILLGIEKRWLGVADRADARRRVAALLDGPGKALAAGLSPAARVGDLSIDQRQVVEILKVLAQAPRVVIFDESTSSLDRTQVDAFFGLVALLRSEGRCVVFISHRMEEVFTIADRVTVLRNGTTVSSAKLADTSRQGIVRDMVGEGAVATMTRRVAHRRGEALLEARGLSGARVRDASFTLHRGEVLGLGGLHGQGQSAALLALFGTGRTGGVVAVDGVAVPIGSPRAAMRRGIAYISGDRGRAGALAVRPILENFALAVLQQGAGLLFPRAAWTARLRPIAERLRLKHPGFGAPISALSGGNQQKVVVGRWLATAPRILLLDDPTKGIDIQAKRDLYALLDELTAAGGGGDPLQQRGSGAPGQRRPGGRVQQRPCGGRAGGGTAVRVRIDRCGPEVRGMTGAFGRLPWLLPAILFAVLAAVNTALQPGFVAPETLVSNLATFLPLILVSVGQGYVVFGGGVDLSLGAVVSLVNVVVVQVVTWRGDAPDALALGLAAGIGTGLLTGLVNGVLLGVLRLQPIVTTFATSIVYGGMALWVLPQAGGALPDAYFQSYAGAVAGVPVPVIILILLFAAAAMLSRTVFLPWLFAVGGNRQAAFQTGLPVAAIRVGSHVLAGLLAALAALAVLGETAAGDPLMGQAFTLTSVSAVVLGCTALSGGAGTVLGSVLGALVIGMINNVIFFAQLPFVYQSIVQGLIILAALAGGVLVARR